MEAAGIILAGVEALIHIINFIIIWFYVSL